MTDRDTDQLDAEMQAELRKARQRFVASFERRCDELVQLAGVGPESGPQQDFARTVHRLVGAAGLVGFSDVSRLASEAERFAESPEATAEALASRVAALRDAFVRDEAAPPSWVAEPQTPGARPLSIVVAEDDEQQRTAVCGFLQAGGHRVVGVGRGDEVLDAVTASKPDVLLLDVQLPGMDGYAICRQIKANPDLGGVSVVFVTAAVSSDERLTGLLLGADDYIEKPVELGDLGMRVALVSARRAQPAEEGQALAPGELTYADFVERVTSALQQSAGALVLLRMPADMGGRVATWLSRELRRGDLLGRYRADVRVMFLPGYLRATAGRYVSELVDRLRDKGLDVLAGFGVANRAGQYDLADLLHEADASLAESAMDPRVPAAPSAEPAQPVSILIADDDDIVRGLLERPLVRAGFLCRIAEDGQDALEQVRASPPDVLVLDLGMPRLSGLEVLESLRREGTSLPKVIVVSARRQEHDVRRALQLGASDYIVKPMNPLTLLIRVRRLLG